MQKKIQYEFFIKVQCPHCAAAEKDKIIAISLPLRGLPNTMHCYNCDKVSDITNILTTGVECTRREAKDEKIKGVTK